jgi:hypothetical protein
MPELDSKEGGETGSGIVVRVLRPSAEYLDFRSRDRHFG